MTVQATRIALAIILAGVIIATALYLKPIPGRYVYSTRGDEVRRFDTATGDAIACRGGRCVRVSEESDGLRFVKAD